MANIPINYREFTQKIPLNQFFKNTEKILDNKINNFSKSLKIEKYRKIPKNTHQHYEIPENTHQKNTRFSFEKR